MDVDRKAELTERQYKRDKEKQEFIQSLLKIIKDEIGYIPNDIYDVLEKYDVEI